MFQRKRRKINQDEEYFEDSIEYCDTLMQLKLLMNKSNIKSYLPIPLIFQHQLYEIMQNRTMVDQEVYQLKQSQLILVIPIHSLDDVNGIVLMKDYQYLCKTMFQSSSISFLQTFGDQLPQLLSSSSYLSFKLPTSESIQQQLIHQQLVLPDKDGFRCAIPNLGRFLQAILNFRKEIRLILKKRPYQEMKQSHLIHEKGKKLSKLTKLPLEYHLQDMIGNGILVRTSITNNDFLLRLIH